VIALLAAVDEGLPERCRKFGASHCLTKPARQQEWEAVLREVFASEQPSETPVDNAIVKATRSLRVLVVDDSPVNVEVVAGLLELVGHQIERAGSGREAVEICSHQQHDVVLMDLEMYDMDGLTATAAIRQHERTLGRHTPIIALTAHTADGFENRCLAAGMDGILSKPLNPDALFALLDKFADSVPHETT
jgi:CheY-like chemotaxis protein